MMRSESTSALGQPSDTRPTRGAGLGLAVDRLALARAAGRPAVLAVGCGMAALLSSPSPRRNAATIAPREKKLTRQRRARDCAPRRVAAISLHKRQCAWHPLA